MKFCYEFQGKELSHRYALSLKAKTSIHPLVVIEDSFFLGSLPGEFAVHLSFEDLNNEKVWEFLWNFYVFHPVKMSRWWQEHFSLLSPEGLFKSLHWKLHRKTYQDWEEWRTFSRNSELLLDLYEFPIHTVRLWDRLPEDIQKDWLLILQSFPFKRNYLSEIIEHLYDLPFIKQKEITEFAVQLAEKYREGKIEVLPQEDVMDMVRLARYPLSQERKKKSYFLKKRIEDRIALKQLHIQIPGDLESQPVVLELRFHNLEQFDSFLEKIQDKKTQSLLRELIQEIYEV